MMLNCGHCIKTAHHALLMLVGVLALELLAHRVAELHVRRWVVGWCAAWRALEPLRAPSGRGRLAKRFGGRAWLAHLVYCGRGCAHREREGASSGGKEQCGASDGRICKEGAKSSGEHPMAGCKEEVLLLNHMQHAGTQSRGAGLHHTRAGSGRALLWTRATEHATCASVGTSPGILVQSFWPLKSLKFEAKRTSFWSARR